MQLNHDILRDIITIVSDRSSSHRQAVLHNLALVCRAFNDMIRHILFDNVKWPHPDKCDKNSGPLFFPEGLWGYFKCFHLDWPDHWPDATSPTRDISQLGISTPLLDRLSAALPRMANLYTFHITCPFYPPATFIRAIIACPNIKDMRITDTPLSPEIMVGTPPPSFSLERVTLVPVSEAIRVGEGPSEMKYLDIRYWAKEYRKRHRTANEGYGGDYYAHSSKHLLYLAHAATLRYIQISGVYFSLSDFVGSWWPNLETLVLTGPGPTSAVSTASLADVVGQMPMLRDLRVLFSSGGLLPGAGGGFDFVCHRQEAVTRNDTVFAQLRDLAVSNVCNMKDAFRYATAVERLAFIALINHPRRPIAMGREDVDVLLADLQVNEAGKILKVIRIMMENGVDLTLFEELARICPLLEVVEVEVCGYLEGDAGVKWADYGNVFGRYEHLQNLRIGIPFAGSDEHEPDPEAFLRDDRRDCGGYIASRVPTLRRIGFEYRTRTGSHRYEDRWLDFDVQRLTDGTIRLHELGPSWYPFPEVWDPVPLQE